MHVWQSYKIKISHRLCVHIINVYGIFHRYCINETFLVDKPNYLFIINKNCEAHERRMMFRRVISPQSLYFYNNEGYLSQQYTYHHIINTFQTCRCVNTKKTEVHFVWADSFLTTLPSSSNFLSWHIPSAIPYPWYPIWK